MAIKKEQFFFRKFQNEFTPILTKYDRDGIICYKIRKLAQNGKLLVRTLVTRTE